MRKKKDENSLGIKSIMYDFAITYMKSEIKDKFIKFGEMSLFYFIGIILLFIGLAMGIAFLFPILSNGLSFMLIGFILMLVGFLISKKE